MSKADNKEDGNVLFLMAPPNRVETEATFESVNMGPVMREWNFNEDTLSFLNKLKQIRTLQIQDPSLSFADASRKVEKQEIPDNVVNFQEWKTKHNK